MPVLGGFKPTSLAWRGFELAGAPRAYRGYLRDCLHQPAPAMLRLREALTPMAYSSYKQCNYPYTILDICCLTPHGSVRISSTISSAFFSSPRVIYSTKLNILTTTTTWPSKSIFPSSEPQCSPEVLCSTSSNRRPSEGQREGTARKRTNLPYHSSFHRRSEITDGLSWEVKFEMSFCTPEARWDWGCDFCILKV